jgi:uncharacterized membrane protein
MNYLPLTPLFSFALFVLFAFVVVSLELRIMQFAYERVGIGRRAMLMLLLLSFLGSYVNIPVATLPAEQVYSERVVDFFGMRYVVPLLIDTRSTVLAVNVGGAIVPTLLSLYLIVKNAVYLEALVATAVVAFIAHLAAHPVPGLGIAEPVLVPPLTAVVAALAVSRTHATPVAYAAGSLGTLIGADLLNLDQIPGLGAPIAAIGGAGKFDGIFVTGLVAVWLTSLVDAYRRRRASRLEHPGE